VSSLPEGNRPLRNQDGGADGVHESALSPPRPWRHCRTGSVNPTRTPRVARASTCRPVSKSALPPRRGGFGSAQACLRFQGAVACRRAREKSGGLPQGADLASAPFAKFQPVKIRPPLGLPQRSHDWRLRGRDFFSASAAGSVARFVAPGGGGGAGGCPPAGGRPPGGGNLRLSRQSLARPGQARPGAFHGRPRRSGGKMRSPQGVLHCASSLRRSGARVRDIDAGFLAARVSLPVDPGKLLDNRGGGL